jgi:hypothetical protein
MVLFAASMANLLLLLVSRDTQTPIARSVRKEMCASVACNGMLNPDLVRSLVGGIVWMVISTVWFSLYVTQWQKWGPSAELLLNTMPKGV